MVKVIKPKSKRPKGNGKTQRALSAIARKRGLENLPSFSTVSAISTAPVAIGNSMSGFRSQTQPIPDGIRIVGRDYGFTPAATGTVTGWACTGGFPLTPACMPTTILRNLTQMYSKFKINKMAFHYITSSSTATTGDVVFYLQKSTVSAQINWTSSTFLPFVLSDPNNVIGPQWTNHTATIMPKGGKLLCDYGINADQEDNSAGDVFLMSKTSSTESPGYVIVDYDISFYTLSYNPRASIVPDINIQWTPFSLAFTGAKTTAVTVLASASSGTSGIGGTTITAFSGVSGHIYKAFFDVTNSTFSTTTAPNFMTTAVVNGGSITATVTDGYTVYLSCYTAQIFYIHNSLENALAGAEPAFAGASVTYSETMRGHAKLVAYGGRNLQYSV